MHSLIFHLAATLIVNSPLATLNSSPGSPPDVIEVGWGSGADFQQALVQAIRKADSIVVTVHSNSYDLSHPGNEQYTGPEVVHASHTLTQDEKALLLATVRQVDPQASPGPMCLFSPHHAIQLHVAGKLDSTIEICFACGDLVWTAAGGMYPRDLIGVFENLVTESGLPVKLNWRAKIAAILLGVGKGGERFTPQMPRLDPATFSPQ